MNTNSKRSWRNSALLFLGSSLLLLACQFDSSNIAALDDSGSFSNNIPDAANPSVDSAIDAAPVAPTLIDENVIVRYRINEAPNGRPLRLLDSIDDSPTSLANLLISYDDSDDGFVKIDEHVGVEFTNKGRSSQAYMVLPSNHKIRTGLQNSQTITLEIVLDLDDSSSGTRLLSMGTRGSGSTCSFIFAGGDEPELLLNGNYAGSWDVDFDDQNPGRIVAHLVINTALAVAENRVILYVNGVIQSKYNFSDNPLQNENIDFYEPIDPYLFVLGNRGDGNRGFEGTIYYAAVYSGALSMEQVAHNYEILVVNDD